jgi:hypothetical protein
MPLWESTLGLKVGEINMVARAANRNSSGTDARRQNRRQFTLPSTSCAMPCFVIVLRGVRLQNGLGPRHSCQRIRRHDSRQPWKGGLGTGFVRASGHLMSSPVSIVCTVKWESLHCRRLRTPLCRVTRSVQGRGANICILSRYRPKTACLALDLLCIVLYRPIISLDLAS